MIATGLGLLAAAAVISWCAGLTGGHTQSRLGALAWAANIAAAVAFVVAGAAGLAGRGDRIDLGALGGLGPASASTRCRGCSW
jgi:hydrogenase-4 component B